MNGLDWMAGWMGLWFGIDGWMAGGLCNNTADEAGCSPAGVRTKAWRISDSETIPSMLEFSSTTTSLCTWTTNSFQFPHLYLATVFLSFKCDDYKCNEN